MNDKEFKAAFGLKKNSKDWDKLNDLLNKKWREAEKVVSTMPDDEIDDAKNTLNKTILKLVRNGNDDFQNNKKDRGEYIRDTALPQIQDFIIECRTAARKTPKKVKIGNDEVDLFIGDIVGYEDMSTSDRAKAEQLVGQKILDGKKLYDDIAGDNPPQVSQKGVTDLCWAMKSLAQSKSGPYTKGALTIPNGDKMRKWLDGLGDTVYLRSSSHLTEQQTKPGQQARGMDFYKGGLTDGKTEVGKEAEGSDGLLPAGMKTLLYQQVELPDGDKALYMKMETAGAFGTSKWNFYNGVWGAESDPPAQTRPECAEDKERAKEHGANYMGGVKEAGKREQVPKETEAAYNELLKAITDKKIKAKLKSAGGKPLRLNNVMHAILKLIDTGEISNDQPDVVKFLQAVEKTAGLLGKDTDTKFKREDMEARFGGEAVLTTNDLGG